jgi:hypothetical protein
MKGLTVTATCDRGRGRFINGKPPHLGESISEGSKQCLVDTANLVLLEQRDEISGRYGGKQNS